MDPDESRGFVLVLAVQIGCLISGALNHSEASSASWSINTQNKVSGQQKFAKSVIKRV
jgi:hypothetical protein